jgi:hypothetical protein
MKAGGVKIEGVMAMKYRNQRGAETCGIGGAESIWRRK